MKLIFWLIWIVLGFCLFMAGCRASISAGQLEASMAVGFPGVETPEIQEVAIDQASQ